MSQPTPLLCPVCGSPAPEQHPAAQSEGEVEICIDSFHLIASPRNRAEYIAAVRAKRAAMGLEPHMETPQSPEAIAYSIVHYSSGPGEICQRIAAAIRAEREAHG